MASEFSGPLAYSYIRMSTDIQLRGDSLRRQEQASKRYAEQHDLQLVEDFKLEDIGVSAFKGANVSSGALGRFLELVRAGQIAKGSYLLVESLDRISRQQILDSVPIFFDIVKGGINVVTLADNHVYRAGDTNVADVIYSVVVLGRAYEESKTKSIRVGAAWENKRKNAASRKLTKVCPAWLLLQEDRTGFDLIPERVEVVRQIFQLADTGNGSFSIARRLNQSAIQTFTKSNGWHESYVTKILNNRAVLGEFQPHRYDDHGDRVPHGEPVAGYFPKVIEEDQFHRVQASRRRRLVEGAGRKGPEYRNLFTKIAKCEYCGAPMRFVHKGRPPKGSQALKCTNAVRGLGCESISWRYSDFETSFLYFVKEIDLTATLRAAAENSERASVEQQITAIEEKIRQLSAKRERIFDLLTEPGSSTAFIKGKLDECEASIATEEALIAEIREQRSMADMLPTLSADELRSLIASVQDMSAPDIFERRAAVANRLSILVTSLRIAADGRRPKMKGIRTFLESQELSPAERDRLIDHIEKSNEEGQRYNRSFKVMLADGVSRYVVVRSDEPTDIIAEVLVDKDGGISGSDRGMPIGWSEGWDNIFDEPASVQ
ncbi:MAG: recombinase family protein [Mesorhizobium sp.]|uniref:recombinase family protein n=1 Tax=unclassified Mesorhizobium TaxID=325217 RepID=UPI000F75A68D|nr:MULTISPECIES: recombinase family protein [unclassified Mesorhizobium]AZO35466.1 recombinase family protein [Mesorhizobium sp. M2A.F.Ca.ET.046.03.2.1]RVC78277.1 recombinase family protein [Mesorhizobium sp. M2A.F.Ca.ET.046.02.1.1]RWB45870.1 MAG: recombinase family protein [Mesorhizobium sp.]RWE17617.1 MAG: recombinase family protein [Mesorhizobium sp.]